MNQRNSTATRAILLAAICLGCTRSGRADSAKKEDTPAHVELSTADTSSAASTPTAGTEYYPAEALREIAEKAARSGNPTKTFGRHEKLWYVEAQRSVTGSVEVHDDWIDATFIQAGSGRLLSGGSVRGGRALSGGEHRGGQLYGGAERHIAAGDFLVIPAGVPHQYEISRGDSLRYLTVKIAK